MENLVWNFWIEIKEYTKLINFCSTANAIQCTWFFQWLIMQGLPLQTRVYQIIFQLGALQRLRVRWINTNSHTHTVTKNPEYVSVWITDTLCSARLAPAYAREADKRASVRWRQAASSSMTRDVIKQPKVNTRAARSLNALRELEPTEGRMHPLWNSREFHKYWNTRVRFDCSGSLIRLNGDNTPRSTL